jgi:hypothetical protein
MHEHRRSIQQIQSVIDRLDPNRIDEFVLAQIAQHICVRLSGVVEVAVRENIIRLIGANSHPRALRYINRRLVDFQNPKPDKILSLLTSFDPSWADKISQEWEPEIKDSIGSIVGQRNIIAHGGSTDVSLVRVKNWFARTKDFCTCLEQLPQ